MSGCGCCVPHKNKNGVVAKLIVQLLGAVLFAAAFFVPNAAKIIVFSTSYILLGFNVIFAAFRGIIKGQVFNENFLMLIATIGAFVLGEYPEASAVMLFYNAGEFLQSLAVEKSKKSITNLMNLRPDTARVQRRGKLLEVAPETVLIGEWVVIKPGEKLPLDGIVIEGKSALDMKALTGESMPRTVRIGDEVLSGAINQSGVLKIKTTKTFGDSTASKILDLIQNAALKKAKTENFMTSFAKFYTPAVIICAVALAVIPPLFLGNWFEWVNRSLIFLIISCPCALVVSVPLSFFCGIGGAGCSGILVKGSNCLETLSKINAVAFDKTGTLTKGIFTVTDIYAQNGFSTNEVLRLAACAESFSNHPIAKSILSCAAARLSMPLNSVQVGQYKEIAGCGISAAVFNKKILVGNSNLMRQENITFNVTETHGTAVYVAADGVFVGVIVIADEIKPDAAEAVQQLKLLGIKQIVMLTGDNEIIAKTVSKKINADRYYAELLPTEKVEKIELLKTDKTIKLAFVGDGINDAPALVLGDIGIAMGGIGCDAAIESADAVLMNDSPLLIATAIKIAKKTKRIVWQNIMLSLSIKFAFLILGTFGGVAMWEAVFADVGVTCLTAANALRALHVD
jgi:Cd2+/Zn2+-exporting ATPase